MFLLLPWWISLHLSKIFCVRLKQKVHITLVKEHKVKMI